MRCLFKYLLDAENVVEIKSTKLNFNNKIC